MKAVLPLVQIQWETGEAGAWPAPAARMRPERALRHSIRALGAPAISRGTASRSQPPFCGGGPLWASLGL